jgi:F-type H+-transporting ATPase subunit alpha
MIIDKDKLKNSVGQVLSLKDGIVRIKGLDNVKANEMLLFQGGLYGLAINLEFNTIGALIFGQDRYVNAKDYVFGTSKVISVPVG